MHSHTHPRLLLFLLSLLALALSSPVSPPSAPLALPAVRAATLQQCSIFGPHSLSLDCYEGPGSSYSSAATVKGGEFYQCKCYAEGEFVDSNDNWDFIPDSDLPGGGCWIAQYYTTGPCGNSTLPKC